MKKIIFFLMFFLVIGSVTATSKEKIYVGDKIPGMYIRKIDSTGKVTNKQGGFLRRVSDDTFVYCLEPFVSLIDGYEYEEYADEYLSHLNISEDVWEDIVLVAYFGYMYADHTEDYWYYITQMMIWRLVDEKGQFYFTDSLGGNIDEKRYQEEIQEIESLVALHKTLPDIVDVTISYGEELIIEDKNGVLSNYELVKESNLVKLDGNNIIIQGNSLGTHKIDLVRKSENYATSPLVYIDSKSQKVMAVGNAIDREFSFNITVSGGKIVINKRNAETQEALNIPGIKFLLYDSNNTLIASGYTDEFGKAMFDNLKIGTYYIKEDDEQIIPGFSINEELVEIEIKDRETIDVDFFNDEVLGKIKIINPDENGEGEISYKGPNVMLGYYKNEEATKEVFDEEGYFKTGDYGKVINEGDDQWIYITGRLKNLIIFSNGKNVYPEEIETDIQGVYGVSEVVVYAGESRKDPSKEIIVAEIYPDFDALKLHSVTDVQGYFESAVKEINSRNAPYKAVGKVKIRNEEFPKNTSRKIVRFKIDKTID